MLGRGKRSGTAGGAPTRFLTPRSFDRPHPDPYADPIAQALVELIAEHGYRALTEAALIERAGTTTAQFHLRFADKQDCTVKTFDAFKLDFVWRVETSYASGSGWREGMRASAYAVADFFVEQPDLVQVLVIELLKADSEPLRVLREETMMYGAHVIERGRAECPDATAVPAGAARMAMGSIAQLVTHRLQKGIELAPHEMVPQMLYLAVRPYCGEEVAREELYAPRPLGAPEVRTRSLAH